MKKLITIILMLSCLAGFSQRVYTGSIDVSTISGADTTLFIPFKTEMGSSIVFDFTDFDADDAVFSFGYSQNDSSMVSIDDSRNPFTLSTATYDNAVNGVTRAQLGFVNLKWGFKYIAFELTKTSVTTGTLNWYFVR